jgi:hypothetical protein
MTGLPVAIQKFAVAWAEAGARPMQMRIELPREELERLWRELRGWEMRPPTWRRDGPVPMDEIATPPPLAPGAEVTIQTTIGPMVFAERKP